MHQKLSAEKAELEEVMSKGSSYIKDMEDKVRKVDNEKKEIDRQVSQYAKIREEKVPFTEVALFTSKAIIDDFLKKNQI